MTPRRLALALLPLDDRPPNLQFARRLATVGGLQLRVPPRNLLGRFLDPGDPAALASWLNENARATPAVIVACDMLAYGGLVASRTTAVTAAQAIRRVEQLRRLKRIHPRLRVYAFAVIPRLGLTVSSPRLAELGPALARYDELRHRPELTGAEAAELARLGDLLPAAVIADHHAMRRRNLAVNERLIALAAEGTIDFLALAQEDAPPTGPHVAEQAQLIAEARRLGAADVVRIFPGADEQGVVLLARAAGEALGIGGTVHPIYGSRRGAQAIALFEDRPLSLTVAGQIDAAGLRLATGERHADIILAVHSPPTPRQTDIHHTTPASTPSPQFITRLTALTAAGRTVALADVAYCNGADPALIAALEQRADADGASVWPRLSAFAGWNTAGNTLGTALAHAALRRIGEHLGDRATAPRAHVEFLFERLVDDYGYQSVVRAEAYRRAREELGESPLNLARGRLRMQRVIGDRLTELAGPLFERHLRGAEVAGRRVESLRDLRVRLPWPRLFEVEVAARIGVE